jgi:hypothetical protein
MMFPVGVAKSSQGGTESQNCASLSGVVADAAVVEPDGVVVVGCVEVVGCVAVVAGVELATVVVGPVAVDEPDPPQPALAITARVMASQRL